MKMTPRVLTLDRTPERLAAFRARHPDLTFEVAFGIDGRRLDPKALVDAELAEPELGWTVGAVGNALSHRELWLECRERGQSMLILEDDATVAPDAVDRLGEILSSLERWDVVFLGYNTDSCLDLELFPGLHLRGGFSVPYPTHEEILGFLDRPARHLPVRVHNVFGLCAYAVSPEGADHFLDRCFPLRSVPLEVPALGRCLRTFSIECLMNLSYAERSAWAVLPPLALTPNAPASSETRRRGATASDRWAESGPEDRGEGRR